MPNNRTRNEIFKNVKAAKTLELYGLWIISVALLTEVVRLVETREPYKVVSPQLEFSEFDYRIIQNSKEQKTNMARLKSVWSWAEVNRFVLIGSPSANWLEIHDAYLICSRVYIFGFRTHFDNRAFLCIKYSFLFIWALMQIKYGENKYMWLQRPDFRGKSDDVTVASSILADANRSVKKTWVEKLCDRK